MFHIFHWDYIGREYTISIIRGRLFFPRGLPAPFTLFCLYFPRVRIISAACLYLRNSRLGINTFFSSARYVSGSVVIMAQEWVETRAISGEDDGEG